MNDALSHLLLLIIASPLIAVLPFRFIPVALSIIGFVFCFILSPIIATMIMVVVLEGVLLTLIFRSMQVDNTFRKYGHYMLLLNLAFIDLRSLFFVFEVENLAFSFSVIRVFMTSKQLLKDKSFSIIQACAWTFVGAFYLPALLIGPVFSGLDLRKQTRSGKVFECNLLDHRLLLQGFTLAIFIAPILSTMLSEIEEYRRAHDLLFMIGLLPAAVISFLFLFVTFWGQSLIAEQTSKFYGIKIPQNFDAPWKAGNIKDFWARWHKSMAEFVMQYLYLPLVVNGFRPKIAVICAFTFMGMWHEISLGYLIWGLAHGVLIAYSNEIPNLTLGFGWCRISLPRLVMWISVPTLSYVARLSFLEKFSLGTL